MQNEYIRREALLEELKRRSFLPVIVKQAIEAVPAADVVEVVRCRKCRWAKKVEECTQWLDSNDFCSYGERREDSNAVD